MLDWKNANPVFVGGDYMFTEYDVEGDYYDLVEMIKWIGEDRQLKNIKDENTNINRALNHLELYDFVNNNLNIYQKKLYNKLKDKINNENPFEVENTLNYINDFIDNL